MNYWTALVVPITRLLWVTYTAILTVFLLVPNPAALIGLSRPPGPPGGRGIHFLFFLALGALTFAARWPIRAIALGALLVLYAVAAETLQIVVPDRTVELLDYLENLAGLAVGAGFWWLVQRWGTSRGLLKRRKSVKE